MELRQQRPNLTRYQRFARRVEWLLLETTIEPVEVILVIALAIQATALVLVPDRSAPYWRFFDARTWGVIAAGLFVFQVATLVPRWRRRRVHLITLGLVVVWWIGCAAQVVVALPLTVTTGLPLALACGAIWAFWRAAASEPVAESDVHGP